MGELTIGVSMHTIIANGKDLNVFFLGVRPSYTMLPLQNPGILIPKKATEEEVVTLINFGNAYGYEVINTDIPKHRSDAVFHVSKEMVQDIEGTYCIKLEEHFNINTENH